MNSTDIRKKFIDFFVERGHTHVPSSSLIPAQDPTLLFANAGMNQFKDIFLGKETRSYRRAVTIQKCMRAGGKHNDLENVGFTKRHLTFFEMMGNFSFGDYFKEDAIVFAWDFLTKYAMLDPKKMYASVYKEDEEAYQIWHTKVGLPASRIVRLGEADNFWQMGETGPCGPCSEIYVDRGKAYGCGQASCAPGCSCDRFLEVWNNVFMQFDRQADGTMQKLKKTGVDTGMGLERLCAIVEDKDSIFETSVFAPLLAELQKLSGKEYATASDEIKASFRVLMDHIRSASFAIADGCMPSNEGRGYVVRKIIRRAALFAQRLGSESLYPRLVPVLVASMKEVYPELGAAQALITRVVTGEVEKFTQNLSQGQEILASFIEQNRARKIVSGEQAFKLYDTYGFPLELTRLIAKEHGFTIDDQGFEALMEVQRVQSGKKTVNTEFVIDDSISTVFTGYDELETTTEISAIFCHSTMVEVAPAGEKCWVITARSPLYVESGGQVSDQGFVSINGTRIPIIALKKIGKAIACEIIPVKELTRGMRVVMEVDKEKRLATMRNHTATHLLQSALMSVVGNQIKQAGSLVSPDHLRFDFTYDAQLTPQQITAVEHMVNKKIVDNVAVSTRVTTLQEATKQGVIAFFGEKYNPESVRMVTVTGFSSELCGGTHVRATGDIGCCKITESVALSAGNRRIVAVTGLGAVHLFQEYFSTTKTLCQDFKVQIGGLAPAVQKQAESLKVAQTVLAKTRQQLMKAMIPQWVAQIEVIKGISFGFIEIAGASAQELRDVLAELLRVKSGMYVIIASSTEGKNLFVVGIASDLQTKIPLTQLAKQLQEHGLKGGASGVIIQGGGEKIPADLKETIKQWLQTVA